MLSHVTQPPLSNSVGRPARVVRWTLFALKLSFKVIEFYLPQDLQTGIFFFIANEIFSESRLVGKYRWSLREP